MTHLEASTMGRPDSISFADVRRKISYRGSVSVGTLRNWRAMQNRSQSRTSNFDLSVNLGRRVVTSNPALALPSALATLLLGGLHGLKEQQPPPFALNALPVNAPNHLLFC
jgi:hypothetical protein